MDEHRTALRRDIPRPDAITRTEGFFVRWQAAFWFWSSVAATGLLGVWMWVMSRESWPQ